MSVRVDRRLATNSKIYPHTRPPPPCKVPQLHDLALERKRRQLKVQRSPITVFDVMVAIEVDEGGGQQKYCPTALDIFQSALNIRIAQMYKAIAAENYIAFGQLISVRSRHMKLRSGEPNISVLARTNSSTISAPI